MIAHHTNGKHYAVTAYNTSTVTLATRSGRPDVVTWAEIDYLESPDGVQRHRDVVDGIPAIIVQSPPPPSISCEPLLVQVDLFSEPPERPKNDFEDAIALVGLIDNDEVKEAVRAALKATFEGEPRQRLWEMLSVEQRAKLR